MEFVSHGDKETQKLAQILGREIVKSSAQKKKAVVIGLEGELGAGKTTFVKGFAKGLGIKQKVSSPTFVLMKVYNFKTKGEKEPKFLFHFDCYRLKDHRDLTALGAQEFFADARNIVLVEWSDRVEKVLPSRYIKIHIDHLDNKTRKITVRK
ncbi:MAG: tRNA (adenosine(37)-N6)-threonylcarbamoyltransferase complex ATPase subunit type 1 TsaE [bacterium]|nr:tRNA (adenosine(37)-N6)-threonylcarbamoyltransferase complex ATPase subunit type 1 TsaE [bacterium]